MSIDKESIHKVANLSRLKISDEDIPDLSKDLNNILKLMDKLNEVDTSNTKEFTQFSTQRGGFRKDEVSTEDIKHDVLKNAPSSDNEYFKVPKVIESIE